MYPRQGGGEQRVLSDEDPFGSGLPLAVSGPLVGGGIGLLRLGRKADL